MKRAKGENTAIHLRRREARVYQIGLVFEHFHANPLICGLVSLSSLSIEKPFIPGEYQRGGSGRGGWTGRQDVHHSNYSQLLQTCPPTDYPGQIGINLFITTQFGLVVIEGLQSPGLRVRFPWPFSLLLFMRLAQNGRFSAQSIDLA